jgi:Bacterial type II/III secretion system short domain
MRVDEERGRTCVRMAAGTVLALMFCAGTGVAQGPDQKPEESYQTFYLKNSTGQNAANDIQTALRNMLPRARIYYVTTENALTIRGTAEDMATAQKILADIDRPQKTYRVTYTISESGSGQGGGPQHFVLIVAPGSKTSSKQGTRVPIVTGPYKSDEPPGTQVQYMDIGQNIEASLDGSGDGLRLHSKIEETSIADEKSNVGIQDPIVKQSVLEARSSVVPGKPVMLGSVDIPGGRHMEVQVTAETVQ